MSPNMTCPGQYHPFLLAKLAITYIKSWLRYTIAMI